MIKKYVELGLGISIVTDICLTGSEDVSKVSLQRFFPDRSYGVVVRKKKYLSSAQRLATEQNRHHQIKLYNQTPLCTFQTPQRTLNMRWFPCFTSVTVVQEYFSARQRQQFKFYRVAC